MIGGLNTLFVADMLYEKMFKIRKSKIFFMVSFVRKNVEKLVVDIYFMLLNTLLYYLIGLPSRILYQLGIDIQIILIDRA